MMTITVKHNNAANNLHINLIEMLKNSRTTLRDTAVLNKTL